MRPGLEARHADGKYDVNGDVRQRLVCQFPDPDYKMEFGNGRVLDRFPTLVVDSTDLKDALCLKVEDFVPNNAGANRVDRKMCELQMELGECPRDLTLEKAKGLK